MEIKANEVVINGITYVPKGQEATLASKDGLRFCIVRCDRSGVFFGWLKELKEKQALLVDARCAWYWSGAASILQMATEGVKTPENCKFTVKVAEIMLTDAIEVIPCTEAAQKNLEAVKVWKQ